MRQTRGLCYRNGYGTAINTDSARYWLSKAAHLGYQFAKDEMQTAEPENPEGLNKTNNSKNAIAQIATENDSTANFKKVKQNIKTEDVSGSYEGYAIRYDWSGKKVLSKTAVKLTLYGQGSQLRGIYTENDTLSTSINATLTDSSLMFSNTSYKKNDRYTHDNSVELEFRNATLQRNVINGEVLITGNLDLWNTKRQEPEKKIYLTLTGSNKPNNLATAHTTENLQLKPNDDLQNSQELTVYPNPFDNEITVDFITRKEGLVNINITDILGKVLYQQKERLAAGRQSKVFQTNLSSGTYLVKVKAESINLTKVLIKK